MFKKLRLFKKRIYKIFSKINAIVKYGIGRYLKTKLRLTKLKLKIENLPDISGRISKDVIKIYDESFFKRAEIKFFNSPKYINTDSYSEDLISPKVFLHRISDATLIGRTEFIIKNNTVYYPKIINPKSDMFMAEIEKYASLSDNFSKLSICVIKCTKNIKKAVSLFGQANGNYLHFLTETLSRLVTIDEIDSFRDYPLLIEDNLHEKFYEALNILNVNDRKIIRLSPYEKVFVQDLIYLTPLSYVPPETRSWYEKGILDLPRNQQFTFSVEGLELLREKSNNICEIYVPKVTKKELGIKKGSKSQNSLEDFLIHTSEPAHLSDMKYVYLMRQMVSTGNGRLLENQNYLMSLLKNYKFLSLDPAELSFPEQVICLRNAKIVIGPIGAALGNLAFCKPGVDVIILSPVYKGATFFYFANLLSALGHNITYVLGKQSPAKGEGYQEFYNRNFKVPIQIVLNIVKSLKPKKN